ncbi:MAG: 2-keto-4-pentenoate hydratase [Hyphomicrobiaceae bacterium]
MTTSSMAAAADTIWRNWQQGSVITELPEAMRPQSRRDGYAAQALMAAKSPAGCIGWKIAATSKAGQTHIGVDGPIAGRLLKAASYPNGATVSLTGNRMRFAEPEFAFRVGRAMAPRAAPYTVAEAASAMDALLPAIEIPDSRLESFVTAGAAQLIADNACGREFIAGPPTSTEAWRSLDLARHPVHARVGNRYTRDGLGANVLDGPLLALTWLVNELSGLGITLGAGEIITTGTCMPPLAVEPADEVVIDFGVLGTVSARFKA